MHQFLEKIYEIFWSLCTCSKNLQMLAETPAWYRLWWESGWSRYRLRRKCPQCEPPALHKSRQTSPCQKYSRTLMSSTILQFSYSIQNVYSHLHHALQQPHCGHVVPVNSVPWQAGAHLGVRQVEHLYDDMQHVDTHFTWGSSGTLEWVSCL